MKPAIKSVLCMLLLSAVAAWGAENHRESLRGLTGVQVRVEGLSDAARSGGLDEKSLAADAEQRLRAAGIRVLAAGQASQEPGAPVLYIRVNVKASSGAPNHEKPSVFTPRCQSGLPAFRQIRKAIHHELKWIAGPTIFSRRPRHPERRRCRPTTNETQAGS